MIDSSNFSLAVLIIVGVVGYIIINSMVDEDRRLPPLSAPGGKRKRLIAVFILIAFIGAYVLNIMDTGTLDSADGRRGFILSSVAGGGVVLFVLAKTWKKGKKHK
jgi:hypothetical protein